MNLVPIANSFLTGSVLTLVLPVAIFIVVTVWLVVVWSRDAKERP